MGVAQSDWQYHTYCGTSKFKDKGPIKTCALFFPFNSGRSILTIKLTGEPAYGLKAEDIDGKRYQAKRRLAAIQGKVEVVSISPM